jgi:hypothetical protein
MLRREETSGLELETVNPSRNKARCDIHIQGPTAGQDVDCNEYILESWSAGMPMKSAAIGPREKRLCLSIKGRNNLIVIGDGGGV